MRTSLRIAFAVRAAGPSVRRVVLAATLCGAVLTGVRPALAQTPPALAGATLDHVGLAVRDIEASARRYAEVFGVPVPRISTVDVDMPGGGKATIRITQIALPNFRIDLGQGVGPNNPFSAFVTKYGDGIQHIGFAVPDRVSERAAALVARGGVQTVGKTANAPFAFVDMTSVLGTTIEAMNLGYTVMVPSDCVASDPAEYADWALKYTIRNVAFVVPSQQIIDIWNG